MFVNRNTLSLLLFAVIATAGCGGEGTENLPKASIDTSTAENNAAGSGSETNDVVATVPMIGGLESPEPVAPPAQRFPEITFKTSLGNIRVRLDAEKASETVDNFLYNYVDRSFYDGTIFHFVQGDFIAIGGAYDVDLNEKEPRPPIRNEADNGLKNVRGTIAMSRDPEYADSATSQFYFNLADNQETLDQTDPENGATYGYCVFGEVIEGLDVLDKIAAANVSDTGAPVEPIIVQSVRRDK